MGTRATAPKHAQVFIEVTVWDKLNKRFHKTKFGGKLFDLDGRQIKLFQPRVFAASVDRSTQTVQNWSDAGQLPQPIFHVTGTRYKRWYSAAQITMANKVWLKHRKSGQGKFFKTVPFLEEVTKHWHLDFVDTGVF